jgi:hypothetical protein
MTVYTLDKRFHTRVKRTPRTLEVAEMFGLGLDDREFVVYDAAQIEVNPGDVVYITGESGSGKSIALRELAKQMQAEGLQVANLDTVKLNYNLPVIDQLGNNMKEASDFLTRTGVNDAYLFLRTPDQLSDGQLYRLKLAKLIESGAQVWVADEFCAVLDRDCAKAISGTLQKMARQLGVTLMVATTHSDMVQDLCPNLTIVKRYREKVSVVRAEEPT